MAAGGVTDGQPVNEAVTDAAFLFKNADDSAQGKIDLANTAPESGATVENTQREVNSLDSFTGRVPGSVFDAKPAWTNNEYGSPTDSLFVRDNATAGKFNASGGHEHTGAPGDAPNISGPNLVDIPLAGYFAQGTQLTGVTGGSTDISTELTGKTPSNGQTELGVVANTPFNKVILRDENGNPFEDGSGNTVYGRVTESSLVWTLTYYVMIAGTETAYSFSGSEDVDWYYQELFAPNVDTPVYSPLATIPSDNVAGDIPYATESVAGKILLANAAASIVAGASAKGTSTRAARQDHAHEGVHSLGIDGDVTQLLNNVQLKPGSGISLSFDSGKILIESTAGLGFQESIGTGNDAMTTFGPLTYAPLDADSVIVTLDGDIIDKVYWSLSGLSVVFTTPPASGQQVYVFYLYAGSITPPTPPTGLEKVEYRTLLSGEASAKQLTLAFLPASAALVMLDLIGGGAQEFNFDFTVASNILDWNGYALDGVLGTGDKLRIHYWT